MWITFSKTDIVTYTCIDYLEYNVRLENSMCTYNPAEIICGNLKSCKVFNIQDRNIAL